MSETTIPLNGQADGWTPAFNRPRPYIDLGADRVVERYNDFGHEPRRGHYLGEIVDVPETARAFMSQTNRAAGKRCVIVGIEPESNADGYPYLVVPDVAVADFYDAEMTWVSKVVPAAPAVGDEVVVLACSPAATENFVAWARGRRLRYAGPSNPDTDAIGSKPEDETWHRVAALPETPIAPDFGWAHPEFYVVRAVTPAWADSSTPAGDPATKPEPEKVEEVVYSEPLIGEVRETLDMREQVLVVGAAGERLTTVRGINLTMPAMALVTAIREQMEDDLRRETKPVRLLGIDEVLSLLLTASRAMKGASSARDTFQATADNLQAKIDAIVERAHDEAEQRGWCSEFDDIMDDLGLPRRVAIYHVEMDLTFRVTFEVEATDEDTAREEIENRLGNDSWRSMLDEAYGYDEHDSTHYSTDRYSSR